LAVEQSDKQARVNTGQLGQHQQSRAGVAYPPIAVSVVGCRGAATADGLATVEMQRPEPEVHSDH
jgi:hypothetical protein